MKKQLFKHKKQDTINEDEFLDQTGLKLLKLDLSSYLTVWNLLYIMGDQEIT